MGDAVVCHIQKSFFLSGEIMCCDIIIPFACTGTLYVDRFTARIFASTLLKFMGKNIAECADFFFIILTVPTREQIMWYAYAKNRPKKCYKK